MKKNTPTLWRVIVLVLLLSGGASLWGQGGMQRLREHVVRSGETLYSLAKAYDTTVDKIYELNPWARDGIRAGQTLLVRPGQASQYPADQAQKPQQGATSSSVYHTVEAGETLYRIALRYGLSEEDIKRANPNVSAEHLPVGYKLIIPSRGATTPASESSREEAQVSEPVRVTLLLPISTTPRYLEYYEGFLMGLMDLKKDGISVDLTVLDTPTDADFDYELSSGAVRSADLIIGGVSEYQTERLASRTRAGYYIIPSLTHTPSSTSSDRIIRLNQTPQEVAEDVVEIFVRRYRQRPVCLVRRGVEEEHPFVRVLKRRLEAQGAMYREVNLDRERIPRERDLVVVPISPSLQLAQRTVSEMPEGVGATLFGYPQWQSYGESFARQIGAWHATFFSTFFFDTESAEGRQFIAKYNAWYSRKVSADYPKMSVMGYDVARYFVRALSQYRLGWTDYVDQIPADGLQLDIKPLRREGQPGWINAAFCLIQTAPDGTMKRQSLY